MPTHIVEDDERRKELRLQCARLLKAKLLPAIFLIPAAAFGLPPPHAVPQVVRLAATALQVVRPAAVALELILVPPL